MKFNSAFLQNLMAVGGYPSAAVENITALADRIDGNAQLSSQLETLVNEYMYPEADGLDACLAAVKALAEKYGENEYCLYNMFILACAPILKERFDAAGFPERVFYNTADDFRCKLLECKACKGVWGTFHPGWNDGAFKMRRFAFGRFQYEVCTYDWENDFVTSCGKVMHVGDKYINIHIPSTGVPLTDDVRLASYKEAYEYYKDMFPDGLMLFCCGSWLLYPRHREFLPKHLNILRFMDDFEVVGWAEKPTFENDWRIYGADAELPYDKLPRKTSLQRAYADWLLSGNKAGDAFCCMVFDGNKIVR